MIFTFIPTPRNAQEAAFQSRIMARGETLLADGYQMHFGADMPDVIAEIGSIAYDMVCVTSPEGERYTVWMTPGAQRCNCPCCEKNKYCKHLVGVLLEDDRRHDEALVAEFEARGY